MSSHVFHEIYLHINWHTKDNSPLIVPRLESLIHGFLTQRCQQSKGVYIHGIGGTENHVHIAVNIEPHVTISDLVGELKGASSHEVNQLQRMKALEWQRGYGVVSFGRKQLPWVLDYIANQKEHHAKGRVFDRLERIEFDETEQAG
ncbi:MAG: IS200/IS605 family transposase [Planctomycetes bacterium]|nr:IS200/IS605 family transposase [Planctomycetota bacterium]